MPGICVYKHAPDHRGKKKWEEVVERERGGEGGGGSKGSQCITLWWNLFLINTALCLDALISLSDEEEG